MVSHNTPLSVSRVQKSGRLGLLFRLIRGVVRSSMDRRVPVTVNTPIESTVLSESGRITKLTYDQAVKQIASGVLPPTYIAVRTATRVGQGTVREYFSRMLSEGIIKRNGRRFELAS